MESNGAWNIIVLLIITTGGISCLQLSNNIIVTGSADCTLRLIDAYSKRYLMKIIIFLIYYSYKVFIICVYILDIYLNWILVVELHVCNSIANN